MSVNTTTNKISYTGDGTTTIFAYNFKILDATHLVVYLNGVVQTNGYSVTGVGADAGGGVVFGTAPNSGVAVFLQRIVPLTQPVSTVDNATILSSVLDVALDRVTMQVQQNSAAVATAVQAPATDPALDMSLPPQSTRANKYFYFDANGEPTVISSQIVGYYYGAQASDPTTRPDGSTRVAGDIYFSTSTLGLRVYTGTAWTAALPTAALTLGNYTEVAATAKTTFTITGGYSVGSTFVYLNGSLLYPTEYTASNGTTVVLASACAIGDEFRCVSYSNFSVADTLSKASNLSDLPSVSTAQTNLGMSAYFKTLLSSASAAAMRTLLALAWGATAAKSTTAQAQAGTDDTTAMTPLTTAQAITTLAPASGGMTLLGTLTTTSGSSVSLTGLDLTSYKMLQFVFNGVSHNYPTSRSFLIGTGQVQSGVASGDTTNGMVWVSLSNGIAVPILSTGALPANQNNNTISQTGYSTATTTVTLSITAGAVAFDAGSVLVYGVK
jgi:hypothetical protein